MNFPDILSKIGATRLEIPLSAFGIDLTLTLPLPLPLPWRALI